MIHAIRSSPPLESRAKSINKSAASNRWHSLPWRPDSCHRGLVLTEEVTVVQFFTLLTLRRRWRRLPMTSPPPPLPPPPPNITRTLLMAPTSSPSGLKASAHNPSHPNLLSSHTHTHRHIIIASYISFTLII